MEATPVHTDPSAAPTDANGQVHAVTEGNGPPDTPDSAPPRRSWRAFIFAGLRTIVLLGLLGGVILLFAVLALGFEMPGMASTRQDKTVPKPPGLGVKLVKGKPLTLEIPTEVRISLGIRQGKKENVVRVQPPLKGRPLVLPGSTALDPTRLMRIRARFAPAEVVSIGEVVDPNLSLKAGRTTKRELRSGDRVRKGDVLGVFYSVDVGNKKNDLFDALIQLELDREILERAEKVRRAVSEVFLLNARRNVQSDRNAINRAQNMLRAWRVPEEDILAVHREAQEAIKAQGRVDRKPETSEARQKADKEQLERWARVTLKAHDSGIIVERNVTKNEIVVDSTVALFQIAKVDRLLVVANAPEDDLSQLLKLKAKAQDTWVIRTLADSDGVGIEGWVSDISYLIDVNQHSAVVKGYIDNPRDRLRAGQFITATIKVPPPTGVVEVPVTAVVDDGHQCVLFVQTDARKHHYTMRRVEVTHRYETVLLVRSRPFTKAERLTAEEKEQGLLPRQALRPGERVLTTGVLELKKELEDRQQSTATKK